MPTVTKAANAAAAAGFAGRWTNPSNAYGTAVDTNLATITNTTKNSTYGDDFGFPDFSTSDIPDGVTINSVVINGWWGFGGSLNNCVLGVLPRLSGADAGTEYTFTSGSSPTSETFTPVAFTSVPTLANLRSASTTIKARVRGTRPNSSTAQTFQLDYVSITVDYSLPAEIAEAGTVALTATAYNPTIATGVPAGTREVAVAATNAAVTTPSAYYSAVMTDSPVAYWRLGETSGPSAYDETANNNTATATSVTGSITFGETGALTGDDDTSVYYDPNAYISATGISAYDLGNGPLSIEMWVKLGQTGIGEQKLFDKGTSGFAQVIKTDTSDYVQFNQAATGTLATSTVALDGSWHHVVCTKSGSTSKIYIDGEDVTSTGTDYTLTNSSGDVVLGANRGKASDFFKGWLDEVAIYGSALTSEQVATHYAAATGASETAPAESVAITAQAQNAATQIAFDASAAAATVSVQDALAGVQPHASDAAVALATNNASLALTFTAAAAAVSIAAFNPTIAIGPAAQPAAISVATSDAAVELASPGGSTTATVVSYDGSVAVTFPAETVAVSVAAYDATVSTVTETQADAGTVPLSVAALQPTTALVSTTDAPSLVVSTTDASVALAGNTSAPTLAVSATDASVAVVSTTDAPALTVTAYDPTVSTVAATDAPAGLASVSVSTTDASTALTANADAAPGASITAYDATVSTTSSATALPDAVTLTVSTSDASVAVVNTTDAPSVAVSAYDPTVVAVAETNALAEHVALAVVAYDPSVATTFGASAATVSVAIDQSTAEIGSLPAAVDVAVSSADPTSLQTFSSLVAFFGLVA